MDGALLEGPRYSLVKYELGHVALCGPEASDVAFSTARADDAGEVGLNMGNHPHLALSLPGSLLPCSDVTHVAVLTDVCSRLVVLDAIPHYPVLSGPFPFPLGLCSILLVTICYISTFLFLFPAFPLFLATTGPSSPPSANKRPIPLRTPLSVGTP